MEPERPLSPASVVPNSSGSGWLNPSDLLQGYGRGFTIVALPQHSILTHVENARPADGVLIGDTFFVVIQTDLLRSIDRLRDFLLDIPVWRARQDLVRLFERMIELQTGNLLGRFAIDMDTSGSDVPVVHFLRHLSSGLLRIPAGPRRTRRMDVYHVLLSVALYPRAIDPSVN